MLSCCHCNCANYISGISIAGANIIIEKLEFDQPISRDNITLNVGITI